MVSDKQVKKLFRLRSMGMSLTETSEKSNMDVKTARRYLKLHKLPSQVKVEHYWRTRIDPFEDIWGNVKELLENNTGLEAKSIFEYLQREYPGKYQDGQIRTFQRKVKHWKATEGPPKEVYFDQVHYPGKLSESDFTDMNGLNVTISGQLFSHKLYHFVLTYSNWETGTVCLSESFESLSEGFQNALWELGGVPREHRTDRLSAAINNLSNTDEFTHRYKQILAHYNISGQKTNSASPHENGDIEQRHYRYKKAIDQSLILRGSRDFNLREDYESFLKGIFIQLNAGRQDKLQEELKVMKSLPSRRIEDYREIDASVTRNSAIRVNHNTYSVRSQLIGEKVKVHLYAEYLDIYYGHKFIERVPRLRGTGGHFIQYRHIIDTLVRKPGAFENYKYRSDMFPTSHFRIAYDLLKENSPGQSDKEYLKILYLAAKENEDLVDKALEMLIDSEEALNADRVKNIVESESVVDIPSLLDIPLVDLDCFDELLEFAGVL